MYSLWIRCSSPNQFLMVGMLVIFGLTFFLLKHPCPFLPSDHGREFAVNGNLSKGKLRGVGLTFVLCFLAGCFLFLPVDREFAIYAILLFAMMLSGSLDDASDHPWNEYKKGLIALIIAAAAVGACRHVNFSVVGIGSVGGEDP